VALVLIGAACLLLLSGAQGAWSAQKVLKIAFDSADIVSLDPGFSKGTMDLALQDMMHNGLLRFKPGDITVLEPDLAERYEVSADDMELTFYLRKGITTHPFEGFPSGMEFTAEDVVWSLEKSADPKRSNYAGDFRNFEARAVDRYTVKVRLKQRIPNPERLLVNYRGGLLVSKKAYETLGQARFKTNAIGTGPFRFVEYVPGQKVVLAAHDRYFRGKPRIDGIEAWCMPEANSREFALRRGELDVVEGVREESWVNKLSQMDNTVVDIFGTGEILHFHINTAKKPFDNLLVRQALLYGTDREEVRTFVGSKVTEPICAQVPPFLPGGLTCEDVSKAGLLYGKDFGKAKDLLQKAGYPNGFDFEIVISERASYLRAAENLQAQWKRIGLNMKLNLVDHPTYHDRIRKDANPIIVYEAMRLDPDQWFYQMFHSNSIVGTGKSPMINFSHTTAIDGLIEAARQEVDRKKQVQIWKQAQLKLLENGSAYPLYLLKLVFARNKGVVWGYDLKTTIALYPQINELTSLK
jgi:peptide/nickel transport system substrate-binding protein